jgi:NAD(P)-dependent dehydrogenase (short-subunit alcohol dehydrogenase family)
MIVKGMFLMASTAERRDTQPVFVILGAAGGIGSCLARRLAAAGARLVLAGRDGAKLEPLVRELEAKSCELDATRFEDVQQCLEEAAQWGGGVNGIANCVGSMLLKPAHLTTQSEFDDVLARNLHTAFAAVRAAAGVMRKSGGSVVLMSSAAARIGLANHEAIAAAKAGVIGLALSAAATYAAQAIRVNVVAPGLVDTPMTKRITSNETSLRASVAMHPLGRIGAPEEVAAAIEWLLRPESSWVTGQVIGVDGGLGSLKTRGKS